MDELRTAFLQEKPASILIEMLRNQEQDKYASILSKRVDCTYSHTVKILNVFHDNGLVTFERTGRKKLVHLTDEGKQLAEHLHKFTDALEQLEAANGHA